MIEIDVSGKEIKQSGQNCGVCGEGNSTEMHLIFGSDWDSYSKRVVFYDAHGQTPTAVLISGSSAIQTISIPFEPLKYEGDIEYVIEGSKENTKKKSVAGRLRVRYAPMTEGAGAPEDVTPTQAEQLQILIAAAESAAKEYADTKAETAEGNAKAYADSKAQAAETAAKSHADTKASAAEKSAKEYADSIKPTKVSELENDSGYLPSVDAIGKKGVGTGAEIFNDYENNKASGYCHAEGRATEACVYGYEIAENGLLDTEIRLKSNKSDYSDINLKVGDYLIFYTEDGSEHSLNPGIKVTDVSALTTAGAIGVNSTKGLKDFGVSPDYIGTSDRSNGNCVLPFLMGAHTEGYKTKAIEVCTHAEGTGTIASVRNQHVQGKYNEIDTERKFAHIVGNGYDEDERSNAHTVDWNGVGWFAGGLKVGGSGQYDGAAKDVATVEQVTAKANEAETAAKSYADTKVAATLAAAEEYSEAKATEAEENAKAYADSIKPTKVSQLENDSGYLLSANAVGKKGTGEGAEIFNDYTNNQATGQFSHAEGYGAKAEGDASHAEGMDTVATGQGAHAEGLGTTASSGRAHAEGYSTVASGVQAHAEGSTTKASAESSHAEGTGTTASSTDQHVQGRWNIEDKNNKYAHIVGNGHQYAADPAVFSNAHTLDWNGVGWFAGGLKVGGSGQDDELAKDVATEEYVDTKLAEKADAYTITTAIENNTLLLADKSDTQLLSAASAALTLTLPETVTSGYECFFSFKSGATATTLTVPSGITWTGADCNSGKEFVPLANTVYEVGIRCIGFSSDGTPYLSARVGAC